MVAVESTNNLESIAQEGKKKIIDRIISDAESEAKDMLVYAEKQVQDIVNFAMNEANNLREEMLKKGEQEATTEKNRILSQARLDMRRGVLEAKEEELSKVLEEAKKVLNDPSEIPKFAEVMDRITFEACDSIGGGEITVRTNSKGKDVLDKEIKTLEKRIKESTGASTNLNIIDENVSGVIIQSKKGVIIDNSFTTRLERRKREIRKQLASILFG